jgi:hypothetical protein
MVKHTRKIVLAIAALVALALGGATLAQAGSTPSKPTQIKHAKAHANAAQAGESETPGAEAPEGTSEAAGSEVPNNDGPGGHADEPGNPTADHQFQGEE